MSHRLLVGLGNPGNRYHGTRHNLGFEVLDRFAEAENIRFEFDSRGPSEVARLGELRLIKPLTFMNLSGRAVREWLSWLKWSAQDLLVVVDDTSLPFGGQLRLRSHGSSGGHNGLRSIETEIGTQQYARLRCGCGPLPTGRRLEDFVLATFNAQEKELRNQLITQAVEAIRRCRADGLEPTMNQINGRRPEPDHK